MSKIKNSFVCENCGIEHSKWKGQCSFCKEWNSIVEQIINDQPTEKWSNDYDLNEIIPRKLENIDINNEKRILTNDSEFDRVLGGGIVPGCVILIAGEPGIGKSTLLLQVSSKISGSVLYVSGEESLTQIKIRSNRINFKKNDFYVLNETDSEKIFHNISKIKPNLLIIDSIQTIKSSLISNSIASVSQIRKSTSDLIDFAKKTNTPVFLIGHITKDGSIAGPKVLEHMVDTVIQFEGDQEVNYRIIRTNKNRYGATNEIGIYEMSESGLKIVKNPNKYLISNKNIKKSGHAIGCSIQGIRPLMIEVQALVSSAVYGTPQRSATGFNSKRLNMILAILEKRAGIQIGSKDVFLNITGGINIDDPSIDLAVISSIISSHENIPINRNICFSGEIGLSGELRGISKPKERLSEAEKLGFNLFVTSNSNIDNLDKSKIVIKKLDQIEDLIEFLFR